MHKRFRTASKLSLFLFLAVLLAITGIVPAQAGKPTPRPTTPPPPPPPAGPTYITLGFDDGYADQAQLVTLLAEHNIKATFYIISSDTGTDGYMTWEQISALYAAGNEIGGHSLTHAHLGSLSGQALTDEVCGNRQDLINRGFLNPISFAYPYGDYDDEARQAVADCGYLTGRMVWGAPETLPPGDAFLTRAFTSVRRSTSLSRLQGYVTETEACGHCWGQIILHHVCDSCDTYAISYTTLHALIDWLQTRAARGTLVVTAGEAIGGPVDPPVAP